MSHVTTPIRSLYTACHCLSILHSLPNFKCLPSHAPASNAGRESQNLRTLQRQLRVTESGTVQQIAYYFLAPNNYYVSIDVVSRRSRDIGKKWQIFLSHLYLATLSAVTSMEFHQGLSCEKAESHAII